MIIEELQPDVITNLHTLQPNDWPNIIPYFHFYHNTDFCAPIQVMIEGTIVGIGTIIVHEDVAWLAHIIVHSEYRDRGIGRAITQTLIDYAWNHHCETMYLIATELGERVYTKLGFEAEMDYLFYKNITIKTSEEQSLNIVPYSEQYKESIRRLDLWVSGEERFFHFEQYLPDSILYFHNGAVEGIYAPSFGDGFIVAQTPEAGRELMKQRLNKKDSAIFPSGNHIAAEFMSLYGYQSIKTAKRMRLGKTRVWHAEGIYNRIGGNLG